MIMMILNDAYFREQEENVKKRLKKCRGILNIRREEKFLAIAAKVKEDK